MKSMKYFFPQHKDLFYLLLTIILIFFISIIFTVSCSFQKLGIYTEETTTETVNSEITSTVLGALSEEYFYEQKNKQLNKNALDDINIRKAILYGIDREKIVKELLGKYGVVSNSLFYSGSDYYFPAWQEYVYDIVKAKEYLKIAGYDTENPLYLTVSAGMESNSRQVIEEMVKEDLEKIGIKIWISNRESKEWYLDYLKNGKYELGVWAIYTPYCEILKNYFSSEKIPSLETVENKNCNNFYWYSNNDVDVIIDKIINTSSKDEKIKLSEEIQSKLAEDAVILPLYNRVFSVAYNNKVNNIEINRLDGSFFKNIGKMDITGESTPILNPEED